MIVEQNRRPIIILPSASIFLLLKVINFLYEAQIP